MTARREMVLLIPSFIYSPFISVATRTDVGN